MELPRNYSGRIGSKMWTFGRADNRNGKLNINGQVTVSDFDVDRGTEYGVTMKSTGASSPLDSPVMFTASIYTSGDRFTVPSDIIREHELKPGHSVVIGLYELEEPQSSWDDMPAEDVDDENKPTVDKLKRKLSEAQELLNELQNA